MSDQPAIATRSLTKLYGKSRGIEELDLRVERGEVFGFLGPNGAGKTTTIRLLLDLIRPTSGSATVCGFDVRSRSVEARARCGYLPGDLALPARTTPRHFLAHMMRLRGCDAATEARQLAERLGLELDRRIGDLSKGNRQKAGIVAALMHRPELLVLDEPTSGLDPLRQRDVQVLVREHAEAGGTVFLSSHALDQVEHVATRVGIVNDARLVAVEEIAALKRRARRRVEVHLAEPVRPDGLANVQGVRDLQIRDGVWRFEVEGRMAPVIEALSHYPVDTLTSEEPELDEIFLEYYGERDVG